MEKYSGLEVQKLKTDVSEMEWKDYVKYVESQFAAAHKSFDPDKVKIGDELEIAGGHGHHDAYIVVTKINRKTFVGVERKGSSSPGSKWTVYKDWDRLRMGGSVRLQLPRLWE